MGLTPVSNRRLQQWVLNEINRSAKHRTKHMLIPSNIRNQISKQTALTGQLLTPILLDEQCYAESGIAYTNRHNIDSYMANRIYKELYDIFKNDKTLDNKTIISEFIDNINNGIPNKMNIAIPSSINTICLTADKQAYTIMPQSSDTAVAIIGNNGPIGQFGNIPVSDWILQSSYLATIYPTVSLKVPLIGERPNINTANVDIPTALLEYNSNILKRMPIYERMAWLTSDINEINTLYPGESRSISPRFKTIHFIAVDQHETSDGIIESYDVDFGQYGEQYRNHVFHPGHPEENIARDNKWHDINEYQGAAQTISTLKRRFTQMLNHDPQLKAALAYTKEHMNDGLEY